MGGILTKDIILLHAEKYPLMQPVDFAKLCYQSVFGVSHFVDGSYLNFLNEEYSQIEKDDCFEKFLSIGNGFVRVNLQPMKKDTLPVLAECFKESSESKCGSTDELIAALSEIPSLVTENPSSFLFTKEEFEAFMKTYASNGYPAVSHSKIYRDAYRPAYRVILCRFLPRLGYAFS